MTIRIRPVNLKDHKEVLAMAGVAGIGMSSLPQDEMVLHNKINNSVDSFAGKSKENSFLFVLEDTEKHRLAGVTGIVAHVGLVRPFYSYKLSTVSQASSAIVVYSMQQVLHMVNDYTGATEIGSLFLHPDYHHNKLGKFLSRSRYMMIAEFPELFSDLVISEIRGTQDAEGNSPFYDNLARHFFKMGFREADYIYATQGGQFIADLMPKYPIYVNLLPQAAQEVIGVPLEASKPALQLLKNEGFHYEGYVDLFDAGPTVQASRSQIKTISTSKKTEIVAIREVNSELHMISNSRKADFMVTIAAIEEENNGVIISQETAQALNVKIGDMVRYCL